MSVTFCYWYLYVSIAIPVCACLSTATLRCHHEIQNNCVVVRGGGSSEAFMDMSYHTAYREGVQERQSILHLGASKSSQLGLLIQIYICLVFCLVRFLLLNADNINVFFECYSFIAVYSMWFFVSLFSCDLNLHCRHCRRRVALQPCPSCTVCVAFLIPNSEF